MEPGAERPLSIAIYGAINSGKSSIVNALLGGAVEATSARGGTTIKASAHRLRGPGQTRAAPELEIVDTPGIAEVGGGANATQAFEAATAADLVLFILPADITEREMQAMAALRNRGKPVIVALNKVDQFDARAREQTLEALHGRLDALIGPENLMPIAASPVRKVVVVGRDGTEREETRHQDPDVTKLRHRIIDIAQAEGVALRRLSGILPDLEATESERARRHAAAEETVDNYVMTAALAVALNPIPLLDVAGGLAAIAMLVSKLEAAYASPLDAQERSGLVGELWRQCRSQLFWTVAVAVGGSVVKSFPPFGIAAGLLMQAGAAGYLFHVVGHTVMAYMENGKRWKAGGAEAALRAVIATVDKASVTGRIVTHVKARMGLT